MEQMFIDYLENKKDVDIEYKDNVKLAPFAKIMKSRSLGNLKVGLCSCINRSELGRYVGVAYFSYLADTHSGNYCTFGSRVSVGAFSHPTDLLTVHEVGYRNTAQLYGDTVLTSDSESYMLAQSGSTRIGNDVWIGDNSVIIKGVEIGNGAIIAAGSIVTKNVAPFSIVAGNPARYIRKRFSEDIISEIQASRWWDFSMKELQGISFENIGISLAILGKLRSCRA